MLSEKLEKLIAAKQKIKEALIAKGMDADTSYENYATAIENISGGGSDFSVEDVLNGGLSQYMSVIDTTKITNIQPYAFYNDSNITSAIFPNCSTIGSNAFYSCTGIKNTDFTNCTSVGNYAFYRCLGLNSVDFPACTNLGAGAFNNCWNLVTANIPNCTSIGYYAFSSCKNLQEANFPACTYINYSAFYNCKYLTTIKFPVCSMIGSNAFYLCTSLTTVSFPACASVDIYAFCNCSNLESIYLLGSSVAYLYNSAVFTGTKTAKSFYVRASLLESWKTKANWAYFSSRFVGLTDEEIAALEE